MVVVVPRPLHAAAAKAADVAVMPTVAQFSRRPELKQIRDSRFVSHLRFLAASLRCRGLRAPGAAAAAAHTVRLAVAGADLQIILLS
jgi:hypothetical protein